MQNSLNFDYYSLINVLKILPILNFPNKKATANLKNKLFMVCTGKYLSEAFIFSSTNPQYNDSCSLNYKFNTWKFLAQNMGRTCCIQKLFLTFRAISVHNMFSPCSAKRRASDKDLPVLCNSLQHIRHSVHNWCCMLW